MYFTLHFILIFLNWFKLRSFIYHHHLQHQIPTLISTMESIIIFDIQG